jgi:hypothetical protein
VNECGAAKQQRDLGDFNERFQQTMEKMRSLNPDEVCFCSFFGKVV